MADDRRCICLVGPMLGKNPGFLPSQGELLAESLRLNDYPVRLTSSVPNGPLRLVDTVACLLRWRRNIDVAVIMVFSGNSFFLADAASLVTKQLRARTILWLHGGNLPQFASKHRARVERVFRRAERLISPSPYLARFFQGWGYQIEVIPNIVDIEVYPFRLRTTVEPRLLWMRAFADFYDPQTALDTIAILGEERPGALLTMAGPDKGLLPQVRDAARARGMAETVRFPGVLDSSSKSVALANHDIFLNTSRIDNMPVSLLEAAAAGLPIVSTAVGGIPFFLDHEKTALLIEEGNAESAARAVLRLIDEPELARRLSSNGRRLAQRSTWANVATSWNNVLSGHDRC